MASSPHLHRWGFDKPAISECEHRQTVKQAVDVCPLTKFEGGLQTSHSVGDDTLSWLQTTATA